MLSTTQNYLVQTLFISELNDPEPRDLCFIIKYHVVKFADVLFVERNLPLRCEVELD